MDTLLDGKLACLAGTRLMRFCYQIIDIHDVYESGKVLSENRKTATESCWGDAEKNKTINNRQSKFFFLELGRTPLTFRSCTQLTCFPLNEKFPLGELINETNFLFFFLVSA